MRTVREVSAGGVIYREQQGQIYIALIHVPRRWGLPKGHVEPGERIDETALREVREETGLRGKIQRKLGSISYTYRAKSKDGEAIRISKRVTFFLLRYVDGEVQGHDHEVDEAKWFLIHQALKKLVFATERKMVRRELNALTSRAHKPPTSEGRAGSES